MATIRIADDAKDRHEARQDTQADHDGMTAIERRNTYDLQPLGRSTTVLPEDGIVNIRSNPQPSFLLGRRQSIISSAPDEDPDLRRSSDFGHKQVRCLPLCSSVC